VRPGCITEGDTLEEAKLMAKDAIKCYIESLVKDGESIPDEFLEFVGREKIKFTVN